MIWTILGVALKVLGFADMAQRAFDRAAAKRQGMDEQKAKDDQATVESATRGARIGSEVAGESEEEVVRDLGPDFRK